MWFAPYYKYLYLLIVTICTLACYVKYNTNANSQHVDRGNSALVLAVLMALLIGIRPVHDVFADTVGYAAYYRYLSHEDFLFSINVENLVFDNVLAWMSSNGFSVSAFFTACSFTYFIGRWWAYKKMFPQNTLVAFLMFLGAFISYTSSVNGFKAGAAASLFCCAIACKDDFPKRLWRPALFLTLSFGIHHSMYVCIAGYIVCLFYKNTKVYLAFWLLALACAVLHVSYFQILFAGLTDQKGASYLITNGDSGWITGMRYDFVIYSAMPVLLGWYIRFKKNIVIEGYDFVLNLYLLMNGMWMLCMYASFTNRIAALSWFMYPMVLCYPFLKGYKLQKISNNLSIAKVMLYQLCFTLFMEIIYYTILK